LTDRDTVDGTDARILAALLQHPRATVMGLAGELRLARSTVQTRLARLEELGALSMENVHSIPTLAGYGVTAFMTIAVHQRDLESLRQALANIPEVIEAYGTTGDGDVMCRVVARSAEESSELSSAHGAKQRLTGPHELITEGIRVDHEDEEGAADPLSRAHAGCTGQSSSPRTARSERLSTEPESPIPGMPAM
jgi:DNA-binding Lrp family transcriptional regulator